MSAVVWFAAVAVSCVYCVEVLFQCIAGTQLLQGSLHCIPSSGVKLMDPDGVVRWHGAEEAPASTATQLPETVAKLQACKQLVQDPASPERYKPVQVATAAGTTHLLPACLACRGVHASECPT